MNSISRTTTNIQIDTIEDEAVVPNDDCGISDDFTDEHLPPMKRRRSSSTGEQTRMFENIAKTIKENHNKKIEILEQAMKPQSDLQLFFASMCKSAEKLDPIEQIKVKMEISRIINNAELSQLEKRSDRSDVLLSVQTNAFNFGDLTYSMDNNILKDLPIELCE